MKLGQDCFVIRASGQAPRGKGVRDGDVHLYLWLMIIGFACLSAAAMRLS